MMDSEIVATSYRLTREAHELIEKLSQANGISRAAVLELAVRTLARRPGMLPSPHDRVPGTRLPLPRKKRSTPGGDE